MPGRTPADRSLIGQIGAHRLHATHDPKLTTARARATFMASFLERTDPSLPMAERLRRAEHLRSEHFKRMALASAKARRAKKAS